LRTLIPAIASPRSVRSNPSPIAQLDTILRSLSQREKVRFVQIGFNDGKTGDPFPYASIMKNWHGVLVEPVSFLHNRLKKNYLEHRQDLVFERVAISSKSGSLRFYYVSETALQDLPGLPAWALQIGSFDRQHVV
jgi:FkbM family methyltransferase